MHLLLPDPALARLSFLAFIIIFFFLDFFPRVRNRTRNRNGLKIQIRIRIQPPTRLYPQRPADNSRFLEMDKSTSGGGGRREEGEEGGVF